MIALIDYGMGNLLSVSKALESVGGDIRLIEKGSELAKADALILPGVGNFGDGMEHLNSRGFTSEIVKSVNAGKPFLGICLGMQMLLESSEEAPGVEGIGLIKGEVVRFPETDLKVPHMGWNDLKVEVPCPCLEGISDGDYFYFVHSYYAAPKVPEVTLASCDYGMKFAAIIGRDNIFATQFHPEKSQDKGLMILKNFVNSIGGKTA